MHQISSACSPFLKHNILPVLMSVMLLFPFTIVSADALLLDEAQQKNLGLVLEPVSLVTESVSQSFPANVIIPNSGQFSVHSPQEGIVMQLLKAVGDKVAEDEQVAVINSPDLITVQRDYLQAYGSLKQVETEWRRLKQLYAEGIVAERRYQEIVSQRELATNEYQALAQQLRLMGLTQAQLDTLRSSGQYSSELSLYSNTDGIVMQQQVTTGQRITAMDNVYMIADLSTLWLEVHVPLDLVSSIPISTRATVEGRNVSGVVTAVGREVHEIDQGVMVRVEVSRQTELLTPGEFVQVRFHQPVSDSRYDVPQSAVVNLDGKTHIFAETKSGFKPIVVMVHSEQAGRAIIELSENDLNRIVVEGLAALKAAWNNR